MFQPKRTTLHPNIRFLLIGLIILIPATTAASSLSDLQQKQQQSAANAKKYRDLQSQQELAATTYVAQIKQTEALIAQVQATVATTNGQIARKQGDLDTTNAQIAAETQKMQSLQAQVDDALVHLYELKSPNPAEMLAGGDDLSNYSDRTEYISSLESQVTGLLDQSTKTKHDLEQKKASLEKQTVDLTALRQRELAMQSGLQDIVNQKNTLVSQSTNQAQSYAQLAQQSEQEKQQFDQQMAAILRGQSSSHTSSGAQAPSSSVVRKGHVHRGDIIGYMGSTGYATGPHTHFSVIVHGSYVDPQKTVGKYHLSWPFPSFSVTQGFGRPNWAAKYSFHNGDDLVASDGYGAPVHAAADGEIIEPFPQYGGWMPGGYGHYVVIDHGNGVWTLYGHLIRN